MTGRLIHAVRELVKDVTADEAADAIWLLGEVYGQRFGRSPPSEPDKKSESRLPPGERPAETAPRSSPTPSVTAEWRLPTYDRPSEGTTQLLGRRAGAATWGATLATGRALRPLRRRMPSRTAVVLDEEATVRQAADSDLWVPASRPALDRWLDLSIVVDQSESMVIWHGIAARLRELMERMGAFRDIRVWRCDTDLGGGAGLTVRPEGLGPGSPGRDVRELVDLSGRRVILLITDCVGRSWATGAMHQALRVWGSAGPAAIVQMLPPRLWDTCAPEFVHVGLGARRPGVPNTELRVRAVDMVPGNVPVPVLALDARSFAPWASLVSGTGPNLVPTTVVFADGTREEPIPVLPPAQSADELLENYASFASTEAMRLARYLAGAPLSLPVMQLIQRTMLPGSRPSVLAEVFLGGLLRRQTRGSDRASNQDEITYDFAPGVRERLLAALPRHDKLAVLATVSDFVSSRLGSPTDFRAFLTGADSAAGLLERNPPFARVALQVLGDIGGRYGDAADVLRRKADARITGITPEREMAEETTENRRDVSTASPTSEPVAALPVPPPSTESPLDVSKSMRQPRIFGGVPSQNPHFTGRTSLLQRLRRMLTHGTTAEMAVLPHLLHGLGGVGKTQLVVEYAHQYAPEYDLVWWVPAESITTVRASLAQLAEQMGMPRMDVTQAINNVLSELRAGKLYRRWLLVFDNAERPEDLQEYLPGLGGHVVVTSRNPQWADVAAQLEVDVFEREESIILLRRRSPGMSTAEAGQLAHKLDDLPLALDQAAAWHAETGMPVPEMIQLLDERMRLLYEHPPVSYPAPVLATWELAFGRLSERSPGAAQLLELCAFFGSEPIAVSLLWDGRRADLPRPVQRVFRDQLSLGRAIREINRCALAKVDRTRDRIEVHRLVQAVLRERMTSEEREAARDKVHDILAMANPGDPDHRRNWERHAQLSPHVVSSGVVAAKSEEALRVALDQIRFLFIRGDFVGSLNIGERVVRHWRESLGPDNELTLIAQRHLAMALRELGELEQAAALNQDTYRHMRVVYGEDHEHTLNAANTVGYDLRLRGEFFQAKALDEENLNRHRRVFASDDPEIVLAMNNLAVDLRILGDVAGALALDSEAYDLHRSLFGDDHPATLMSLANVARDHFDAGRYRDAQGLLTGTLPNMVEWLGENHRATAIAKRVLAMVQRRLGYYRMASDLAGELYRSTWQRYRPDHERMLATMVTYANTLLAVGEVESARSLADQALQRYRQRFGDRHPFALALAVNLGIVMRLAGEFAKACELDEAALRALRQDLGDNHPYTIRALLGLAADRAAVDDHEAASSLSKEAYHRSRDTCGENHPDTLICALNHSLDLHAIGDHAAARALREDVLARLRKILGDSHPQVRAANDGQRIEGDIEIWAM